MAKTQTQRRTLIDVLRILEDQAAVIRSHLEAHGQEFEMDLLLVPRRRIRFVYDSEERDQAARDFGFMVSAMEREEVKKVQEEPRRKRWSLGRLRAAMSCSKA